MADLQAAVLAVGAVWGAFQPSPPRLRGEVAGLVSNTVQVV